jgi:hypothetical protein
MQKEYGHPKAYLQGKEADDSLKQVDSFIAAEFIPFGYPVVRSDPNDPQMIKLADKTSAAKVNQFLGISVRQNLATGGGTIPEIPETFDAKAIPDQNIIMSKRDDGYAKGSQVAVMTYGRIAVKLTTITNEKVTVGTHKVIYTLPDAATENAETATGAFSTADQATDETSIDTGVLMSKAKANDLVIIQVNKNI